MITEWYIKRLTYKTYYALYRIHNVCDSLDYALFLSSICHRGYTILQENFPLRNTTIGASVYHLWIYIRTVSQLYVAITMLTCISVYYFLYKEQYFEHQIIKAMKLDIFLFFLAIILDAKFNFTETVFQPWIVIRVFVSALPQFLRKPIWLKVKLQDMRSKLGPVYVLYVALCAMKHTSSLPFADLAALTSCIAGIIFRPDNGAVLELLGYETKLPERRYWHGRLMIVSLVTFMISVIMHSCTR